MRILRNIVLTVPLIVAATPVAAESITGALQRAYDHNATLNAQRAATRAADEQLPQAISGYRPTVSLSADAGFSRSRTQTFVEGGPGFIGGQDGLNTPGTPGQSVTVRNGTNPYGVGVTIQQSLFSGFRVVNGVRAAEAAIKASRQTLANVEQNTLLTAAQAYAAVFFSRQLLDIRQSNISFLNEQLRSSNARLEVGEGTRTDVAQSRGRLALGQAQLAAARGDLASAEGVYFQVIGQRPTNLSKPNGPAHLYPRSLQRALELGESGHPAILATQNLVDFAQFNVKVAEGALLPTVTAQAQLQQRANTQDNSTDTQSAQATVSLNVPLYQGGLASSRVRESKQVLAQRRIQVDESRDQVRAEIVTAWNQLQSARANVAANRQQVSAARLALSGVVEERNVGQRTQLDVLDEQTRVLNAQELLLQGEQLEVTAGYRLVAAIGKLSSRKLGLKVDHYDPKEHYVAVKDKWFGLRTPTGR